LPAAVSEKLLERLRGLASKAEAALPEEVREERQQTGLARSWGEHFQTPLSRELLGGDLGEELRALILRADSQAGWSLLGTGRAPVELRRGELREYLAVGEHDAGASPAELPHLAWQDLGTTHAVLAVPLDEGLEIEVRRHSASGATPWTSKCRMGDAIIWRGWDEHRVAAPRADRQRLLLLEWWPPATKPRDDGAESEARVAEALKIDPESAVLALHMAFWQSKPEEARAHFKRALELAPVWDVVAGEYGASLAQWGERAEAKAMLQSAMRLRPSSSRPLIGLARLAIDDGDDGQALALARKATELDPSSSAAFVLLADVLGSTPEAEVALRKALELSPNDPMLHHYLGTHLATRDIDLEDAEAAFKKAVELDPNSPAWFDLGLILQERGELKGAARSYSAMIQAHPADVRPRVNMALMMVAQGGKVQLASRQLGESLKLEPHSSQVLQAIHEVVRAQVRQGDFKGAGELLQQAVAKRPEEADLSFMLAAVKWKIDAKPTEELRGLLDAAAKLAPHNDDVRDAADSMRAMLKPSTPQSVAEHREHLRLLEAALATALATEPQDEQDEDDLEDEFVDERPKSLFAYGEGDPIDEDADGDPFEQEL